MRSFPYISKGFLRDCPDGELSTEDLKEVFRKYFVDDHRANCFCKCDGIHMRSKFLLFHSVSRYLFNMFDINKDGSINFVEFLLAIAWKTQDQLDQRLELAFDMFIRLFYEFWRLILFFFRYDVSGNGELDQNELTRLIIAMVRKVSIWLVVFI